MIQSNVLVVGSLNADDIVRVASLPAPGETVTARSTARSPGGKGANQAIAAARAGARVRMVGAVGASDGDALTAVLDAEGIDTASIARLDKIASGRATVLVDDAAENSIVVVPGANAAVPDRLVREACGALRSGDVLLLQHEVPARTSQLAAAAARSAGATVVWNAAPAPTSVDELIDDVDLLLVNEQELVAVAALLGIDAGRTAERIAGVAATIGADVVCTLGASGAAFLLDDSRGSALARRVEAVDTTAAGDTFAGYLAAFSGLPIEGRLRRALDAASLAVTTPGAALSIPHRAEVEDLAAQPL